MSFAKPSWLKAAVNQRFANRTQGSSMVEAQDMCEIRDEKHLCRGSQSLRGWLVVFRENVAREFSDKCFGSSPRWLAYY